MENIGRLRGKACHVVWDWMSFCSKSVTMISG